MAAMATPQPKLSLSTQTNPKPNNSNSSSKQFSDHPSLILLERCKNTKQLPQIHAHLIRLGLIFHPYPLSRLLTISALSNSENALSYALKIFEQIPQPNLYMYNTIIRAHASSRSPENALLLYTEMLHQNIDPNKFTFPFLLKAIAKIPALLEGKTVHGMVLKAGLSSDAFVQNSLIHFYANCGNLADSHLVFAKSLERDVVSWNSMINAYAQSQKPDEVIELFVEMERENVRPNDVTMVGVLSACAQKGDLELGRWACDISERNNVEKTLTLSNAKVDMYAKCGSLVEAQRLFDEMHIKDEVSWTSIVIGYAKMGDFTEARKQFDIMPKRDIAAWNALISAYEQGGHAKEAIALFHELQIAGLKLDEVTLVSTLSACSQLGAMDMGKWIHIYIEKHGLKLNFHLTTALIDMYAKCGDLMKALEVFRKSRERDVYAWSAMIAGMAMHGHGQEAIHLFHRMQEERVEPNGVTFTNVLCACSHAGLVDEGRECFSVMKSDYNVKPNIEHYGCMVDMLGRAGLLEEAMELIGSMPFTPQASIWGTLLGACQIHGNVKLGELACHKLLNSEPSNDGAYVLLSNIYAKAGQWDDVTRVRKLMREKGVKKEPGGSLIEVDGEVHEFLVGDIKHPLSKNIYSKLGEVAEKLKSNGYVPNRSQLLQEIEGDDVKDKALYLHSEKLAISFGLISTCAPVPIRVVKNLRVCSDCHSAAKLISSIYGREILLRDRYRFHHFKDGVCSCKDYW
ncbi:pentatricopeptide repeat-containing protein At2g29760, chloroplastic [Amborella trichopoda]|nr:pentatricopeptide repeat-containing protein At2g29760, chloroplastic [Amborella trichopoda]|eukprot:XP_011627906.1 pentatricopeptide repeat-containing protein At2g29760, chloroplastic [Amborella trichopoda]